MQPQNTKRAEGVGVEPHRRKPSPSAGYKSAAPAKMRDAFRFFCSELARQARYVKIGKALADRTRQGLRRVDYRTPLQRQPVIAANCRRDKANQNRGTVLIEHLLLACVD